MRCLLMTALALAILAAPAALAARPHAAGPKEGKPEPLVAAPAARVVFDCSGRDTLVLVPGLVDTLRDDTTGGPTDLDGYACRTWPEAGPEHVYRLEVAATLELLAGLRGIGGEDLDLFLLNGCDTDSCLIGENIELGAVLDPGTYFLVVDGFGLSDTLSAGPYALALETRWPGVPPQVCDGTVAETLTCDVGTVITRSGSLFGQPDLVRTYDCSPFLTRAGEDWYALELLPGQEVTAQTALVADTLDAALWLFDGCGPDARCLAFADDGLAGENETLQWQSETAANMTVYLAVDGARPPETEAAGTYQLGITCGTEVPTEPASFGTLRARWR